SATTTRCARASRGTPTSCVRSSTTSAPRSAPPTSWSRAQAAPSGRSRQRASPRSSSPIRTRPPTTSAATPSTSPTPEAHWSWTTATPHASSRDSSPSCSPIRSAEPAWATRCARRRSRTRPTRLPMSSSPLQPLAGRRIWIAGIGGAGMSAYGLLAHAWGAEVAGWDRVETPYLAHLDGIDVTIADEPPAPPPDYEVYVSSAFAERVEGRPRAELLAELVSLRRSIVVAGAHGKTTTSGMIAFCLERLGHDPDFLIGGEIPQLGGNAGAGTAVLLNVDLDHHATFGSRAAVAELFEEWLAQVPHVVRAEQLEPLALELAVPGEHNRRNAAAAVAALELVGVDRRDAERVIVEFAGAGRRLERKGEAGGVAVLDSYAHHPAKIAADLAAVRDGGRVLVLFQPHLFSRTAHLARDFGRALADADAACVTDVYAAREAPVPGVTGRLIVDALAEIRPGMRIGWAPRLEDAAALVAGWARAGDTVLTLGAGDVDRAAALVLERLA